MSTVAEQLRQARETQHLTVHQVAEITKIRTDHIRALEEGNFDLFSAPVYIRGFVRSYASLLKLDVPQTMATLDTELKQTAKHSEPPPLTPQRRGFLDFLMLQLSKFDWRRGLLALGILAGVVILGSSLRAWRQHRTQDPLQGLPPGIYQTTNRNAGDTLSLPTPGKRK